MTKTYISIKTRTRKSRNNTGRKTQSSTIKKYRIRYFQVTYSWIGYSCDCQRRCKYTNLKQENHITSRKPKIKNQTISRTTTEAPEFISLTNVVFKNEEGKMFSRNLNYCPFIRKSHINFCNSNNQMTCI